MILICWNYSKVFKFSDILNKLTYVNILTIIYVLLCSRIAELSFNICDRNLTFKIQENFRDECDQTNTTGMRNR
jgi:hypothetical protein